MKMLYNIHYTDGDPDDYRTTTKFTLSVPNKVDAEMLVEMLTREGKNPILEYQPLFDDYEDSSPVP
jgi:hypothetical protein